MFCVISIRKFYKIWYNNGNLRQPKVQQYILWLSVYSEIIGGGLKMEAKELKKLSRSELLEMLLDRSKEVEHLRKELDETKKHIATLEREVQRSGDINDAIGKLNEATEEIQKFAAVISLATKNLGR